MPKCPFCKGQIGEDLLRFGGHCPHCLNEVPGEETATDPGAEARARHEAEMRATAARIQRRTRVLGAGIVAVVLAIPIAWFALCEKPQPLVLDDAEIYIAPASAHQNALADKMAADEAQRVKDAAKQAQQHHASTSTSSNPAGGLASASDPLHPITPPPALLPDGTINPEAMNRGGLGVDIKGPELKGPELRLGPGIELSSDEDIKSMVLTFLKSTGVKQLQQCYETRLKENPSLSGRWNATFVIEKDGLIKSASAEGQSSHDRDLETCLIAKMEAWKFQSISHSVEITRPLVFQGG